MQFWLSNRNAAGGNKIMHRFLQVRITAWLALLALLAGACAATGDRNNPTSLPQQPPAQPTATQSAAREPRIQLEECQLSSAGSSVQISARCGTLPVSENPDGTGPVIHLNIAVIPAVSRNPEPDPLFFLTGGPGQAATESFLLLSPAFDRIRTRRDIVLVDQRGTGKSNPLNCEEAEGVAALEPLDTRAEVQACLDALDAQPQFYTTPIAMADLDKVRVGLGYSQINIYGLSYGTRAALTYLKYYPERVRSLILDGVAHQDEALGSDAASDAQHALDLIFARCEGSGPCTQAFPNVQAEFYELLEDLRREPAQVRLAHPSTGETIEVTFTAEEMGSVVRLLSYTSETAALLPLLIHQAYARQDYAPLAAQYQIITGQLVESISSGMNFSVLCTEDVPFYEPQAPGTAGESFYLGDTQVSQLLEICAVWPRGSLPQGFKEPVVSSIPVLLLSGEADPVTPPSNGEQAARTLENSLHLILPGQGHNIIFRGCIPNIAAEFLEQGSVTGLDTGCSDQLQPMPFFVNPSGPYLQP
jgi:pimeloyl-ACP methyl ester carboxylesterase